MRYTRREVVVVVGCDSALGAFRREGEGRKPLAVLETWVRSGQSGGGGHVLIHLDRLGVVRYHSDKVCEHQPSASEYLVQAALCRCAHESQCLLEKESLDRGHHHLDTHRAFSCEMNDVFSVSS